jgi:hypothetical protein
MRRNLWTELGCSNCTPAVGGGKRRSRDFLCDAQQMKVTLISVVDRSYQKIEFILLP